MFDLLALQELVKDIHINDVADVNVAEDRVSVHVYFHFDREPLFLFKLDEPLLVDDFKEQIAFKVFDQIPGAAEAKALHALQANPFKGIR